MDVALVIPARGTSETVKNPNLLQINGKPLVRLACEKGLSCRAVDHVYLDTEDEGIIMGSQDLLKRGLQIIRRPRELATKFIGANELMVWALHNIPHTDLLLQSFPTSPLITARTIDRCVTRFLEQRDGHDSFFTVSQVREYFWQNGAPLNFDPHAMPNSAKLDVLHMQTDGLFGIFSDALLELQTRVGQKPMLIDIPRMESLKVRTEDDLDIARKLFPEMETDHAA